MSPDTKQRLKALLLSHESFREFPYLDETNHLTIGVGRNLTDRGISYDEAMAMLEDDMSFFEKKMQNTLNFFSGLDETRQIALVDMCFNIGLKGFLHFEKLIAALEKKDYEIASQEILNSKWATQVGQRAIDISEMIRTGK